MDSGLHTPSSHSRLVFLCVLSGVCLSASTISLVGALNPADAEDVFLYSFALGPGGNLIIQSWGYGGGVNAAGTAIPAGGFDAYVSLFSGAGSGAVFLTSDDDSGCPPGMAVPVCGDPRLVLSGLPAGEYTLALTTFGNISFAENLGAGTLGDGFVGLGSYYDYRTGSDRTSSYALDISGDLRTVPEPCCSIPLAFLALGALRRASH